MRQLLAATALVLGAIANNSMAEVTATGPGGFVLTQEVTIAAERVDAWQAAVNDVGLWWSDDHTISGSAAAMAIDPRPLGCFCEALPNGGGVVHLTVTFVNTQVLLRMTGGLGPLGLMGVDGNMTWEFFDADEGTRVRFTYAVGGYSPDGLDKIAGAVDYVIGEALLRLKAYVETGEADTDRGG